MRFFLRLAFSIVAALATSNASATCSSITASVTPTSFISHLPGAGNFAFATLNVTATDCIVGTYGGFYLAFPIGNTPQPMVGPTNVYIEMVGSSTPAVSNGSTGNNCVGQITYLGLDPSSGIKQTVMNFTGPAGFRCNVTASLQIMFSKPAGAVAGTASAVANPINVNPKVNATNVPTLWVSKVNYQAPFPDTTPTQTVGLTAPLNFAQALCTLSFTTNGANNTVNLPATGVNNLAQDGATAGSTPFDLNLSSCSSNATTPVAVNVTWGFTAKNSLPTVIDTGIAQLGVQVKCGNVFISNATPSTVATLSSGLSNGSFSQACSAMYVAVGGAAAPGTFSVPVTVTMGYQ